jgi:glycosyltransferase involved in cell wall biosynthesis
MSDPPRFAGAVHVVTIAARNYLASVILLGESLRRVMGDWPLTVLLIDATDDELASYAATWPWLSFMGLSGLDLDAEVLSRMRLYYDLTELATALKPTLLASLLARADVVMYLDPDIEVFGRLDHLATAASSHGVALTPHVTAPSPRDGRDTSEEAFLTTGQFNLGFIAVAKSGTAFLDYWATRLERHALVDFGRGYFTDQRWVDAVPSLFDHQVIFDLGCNVAYWNLHQRALSTISDGSVLVDGAPLRFFHYSGHDAEHPLVLSKYAPRTRVSVSASPTLRRLLLERAERISAIDQLSPEYRWDLLPDGRRLCGEVRRGYWWAVDDALRDAAPLPPEPGWIVASAAFDDWLADRSRAGLPRLVHLFWRGSERARQLFDDPERFETAEFAEWLAAQVSFQASATAQDLAALRSIAPPEIPPVGANVIGYLAGEFGMGEHARKVASSIRAAGYPVAEVALEAPGQVHREREETTAASARYAVNVVVVNADVLGDALVKTELWSSMQPRPTAGVWAWELPEMPRSLAASSAALDELWCGSTFVRDALVGSGVSCPVHVHPWLVEPPVATQLTRADLGLDADRFLFGFCFDVASVVPRKNPFGLLDAYLDAFGATEGVGLVLKTINAGGTPVLEALRSRAAERDDVQIVDGPWRPAEMRSLFQHLDCYVSLHRSEGTGLTMLEAMAASTPVIATGYSGNLDFMDSSVARLVPCKMVEVGSDAAPYPPGALWAEPDLAAASEAMREMAGDPSGAAALGAAGAASIFEHHGRDQVARWFAERIAAMAGVG